MDNSLHNTKKIGQRIGQQPILCQGAKVIGLNDPAGAASLGAQGGPVSLVLNIFPRINATAGFHDWIFNSSSLGFNIWTNIATMVPAAGFGITAAFGNPNISYIIPIISPSVSNEKNK